MISKALLWATVAVPLALAWTGCQHQDSNQPTAVAEGGTGEIQELSNLLRTAGQGTVPNIGSGTCFAGAPVRGRRDSSQPLDPRCSGFAACRPQAGILGGVRPAGAFGKRSFCTICILRRDRTGPRSQTEIPAARYHGSRPDRARLEKTARSRSSTLSRGRQDAQRLRGANGFLQVAILQQGGLRRIRAKAAAHEAQIA